MLRKIVVEPLKVCIILELPCICGSDSDIRLYYDRKSADLVKKFACCLNGSDLVVSRRRNARFLIKRLHCRLALPHGKLFRLNAGADIEILSQLSVLLKPVLSVGFEPVDLSVFKGKKCDCTVHGVVVLHVVYLIILCKSRLQRFLEHFVRRVSNSEHIYAVLFKSVAELPVSVRKIR